MDSNNSFATAKRILMAGAAQTTASDLDKLNRIKRLWDDKPYQYSIGIIGLGELGKPIAESLSQYYPDINRVFLYDRNREKAAAAKRNLDFGGNQDFEVEVETLDNLIKESDLILITAGKAFREGDFTSEQKKVIDLLEKVNGLSFRNREGGRGVDYRVRHLAVNLPMIQELAYSFKDKTRGKHVILYTNPPDILSYVFALISGADLNLSGFSHIDTFRSKNILLPRYFQDLGIQVTVSDHTCIGDHGGGVIPVLQGSKVNEIPLEALKEYGRDLIDVVCRDVVDYPATVRREMGLANNADVTEFLRAETPIVMREIFKSLFDGESMIESPIYGKLRDFITRPPRDLQDNPNFQRLYSSEQGLFIGFNAAYDFPFARRNPGLELNSWVQERFFERYRIMSDILDLLREAKLIDGYVEPRPEEEYRNPPKSEAEKQILVQTLLDLTVNHPQPSVPPPKPSRVETAPPLEATVTSPASMAFKGMLYYIDTATEPLVVNGVSLPESDLEARIKFELKVDGKYDKHISVRKVFHREGRLYVLGEYVDDKLGQITGSRLFWFDTQAKLSTDSVQPNGMQKFNYDNREKTPINFFHEDNIAMDTVALFRDKLYFIIDNPINGRQVVEFDTKNGNYRLIGTYASDDDAREQLVSVAALKDELLFASANNFYKLHKDRLKYIGHSQCIPNRVQGLPSGNLVLYSDRKSNSIFSFQINSAEGINPLAVPIRDGPHFDIYQNPQNRLIYLATIQGGRINVSMYAGVSSLLKQEEQDVPKVSPKIKDLKQVIIPNQNLLLAVSESEQGTIIRPLDILNMQPAAKPIDLPNVTYLLTEFSLK